MANHYNIALELTFFSNVQLSHIIHTYCKYLTCHLNSLGCSLTTSVTGRFCTHKVDLLNSARVNEQSQTIISEQNSKLQKINYATWAVLSSARTKALANSLTNSKANESSHIDEMNRVSSSFGWLGNSSNLQPHVTCLTWIMNTFAS